MAANRFQIKRKRVTEGYSKDIWRSLDKDVFPAIGAIPVQEIKARTILEALESIAAETVRGLLQCINELMIYAVDIDLIDANLASGVSMDFEKPKSKICRPQD